MNALFFLCLATEFAPPPPKKVDAVVVVVEDVKARGFRIADGQKLVTRLMRGLKERVGQDAVIYEGVLLSMKKMNALVKEDPGAQTRNRLYYEGANKNAPFRFKARFSKKKRGPKGKRHYLSMACHKRGEKTPLHKVDLKAGDFDALLEKALVELKTFCPEILPKKVPEPKIKKKKKLKKWTPPPSR